jgi:hypothetical protein
MAGMSFYMASLQSGRCVNVFALRVCRSPKLRPSAKE